MSDYTISFKDEASPVAQRIQQSVAAMRSELKAVGAVRLADGTKFATWAKATALQTAARIGSEMAAVAMIRRTTSANLDGARAAGTRAAAEGRLALALMRSLHYEMRLAHYRGRGGASGVGGGGGGVGGVGGPPGGNFVTDPLGRMGKALPWIAGGAAAGVAGIGVYMGARAGIQALTMAASAAISVLGGLAAAVGRVARAVGGLTWEFGKATVSAFDFRTRGVMAFKAMTGDGERGFARMQKLAVEMGTSMESTFTGVRSFIAAGFKTDAAEQWFKRTQDLAGIGLNQEQIGRATLAIGQIKGAGTLQGDELRQLGELGISMDAIWTEIAKKMGKTVGEAKKLKEAGKVSSAVALTGIEAAISKMTGGGAAGTLGKEMGRKTVAGFLDRASLLKSLFFDRLAKEAGSGIGGLVEKMSTAADDILGWMKGDDAAAFFGEIGKGIRGIADDLGSVFGNTNATKMVKDLRDVAMSAWHVAEGIWSVTKAFAKGLFGKEFDFAGTKRGLEWIATSLKSETATAFFTKLGEGANRFANALFASQGMMADLVNGGGVSAMVENAKPAMSEAGQFVGQAFADGIVVGIAARTPVVRLAAWGLGTTAEQAAKSALGIESPSKVGTEIGRNYSQSVAGAMAANDNVGRAAHTMASDVRNATATGLGVSASGGVQAGGVLAGATTSVQNSHKVVNLTVNYQGGGTGNAAERDDFEAWLVDLLERVA